MRFIKILLVGLLATFANPALADIFKYEAPGVVDYVDNGVNSLGIVASVE